MKIAQVSGVWKGVERRGQKNIRVSKLDGTKASDPDNWSELVNKGAVGSEYWVRDFYTCYDYTTGGITKFPLIIMDHLGGYHQIADLVSAPTPWSYSGRAPQKVAKSYPFSTPVAPLPLATPAPTAKSPRPDAFMPKAAGGDRVTVTMMQEIIDACPINQGIMIWGPPGIGKSNGIHAFADSHGLKVADVRLSQVNPIDIRGIGVPDLAANICRWLPADFLPTGPGWLLFLDELSAAPLSVQAAAYQLVLDRRSGNYKVPDDCRIIAAGNRTQDRGVAFKMPSALANRFLHLDVCVSIEDWRQWASRKGVSSDIIAFLTYCPGALHDMTMDNSGHAWPSPRSWEFADKLLKSGLSPAYKKQAIAGCVGAGATRSFYSFMKSKPAMPDIYTILNVDGTKPSYSLTPEGAIMVIDNLLSRLTGVDDAQLERVIRWAMEFNSNEYTQLVVSSLLVRFGEDRLKPVLAYKAWLARLQASKLTAGNQ